MEVAMPAPSAIPGLKRLPKPGGFFTWYWSASQISRTATDFKPRTVRLWHGEGEPSEEDLAGIAAQAEKYTLDLGEWLSGRGRAGGQAFRMRRGSVYFLRAGERIKIGFATNVARRVRDIRAHLPDEPELVLTMYGSMGLERALHARFASLALRNEWFRLEAPITSFITKLQARQQRLPSARTEEKRF